MTDVNIAFKIKDTCRCCGGSSLKRYLDLGTQPLANDYFEVGSKIDYFSAPLKVDYCQDCFHSQLSVVVRKEKMFDTYLYVSGTTKTFNDHCESLAKDVVGRLKFAGEIRVLDIASNDGTLLSKFKGLGCSVIGVDPAVNMYELSKKNNVETITGYWDKKTAAEVVDCLGRPNVITATNVFAHVDDVSDFLKECAETMTDDGLLVIEVPYCLNLLKNVEFDTIYHEHLSYFNLLSFCHLLARMSDPKLFLTDVVESKIHGGSIRFYLSKDLRQAIDPVALLELIEKERRAGLHDKSVYDEFQEKVTRNVNALEEFVTSQKPRKIVGYGASAKGNTLLNFSDIDIEYIVDDNELKYSMMTPGRKIPILSPDMLKFETDIVIVVLSWNFFEEITERIRKFGIPKATVVTYVPCLTTEIL